MTISIIIATYNAAATLRRCLDSIVPQLTAETELIMVDGASEDGTNSIIDSYENSVSVHISEPDKGIYDAWNKGVKAATGDWVMFVGADDVLLDGAIETYLKKISGTPDIGGYDYVCSVNEYVDMEGKLLKLIGENAAWRKMRRTMVAAHVASLHNRKSLFGELGGYDTRFHICADYELLLRKRERFHSLFIPNARIARMRVGGMSFSSKAIVEAYKARRLHHTLPCVANEMQFLRDWLAFKFFIVRKTLRGGILTSGCRK